MTRALDVAKKARYVATADNKRPSGSLVSYATISDLPTTASVGQMAHVQANDTVYLYDSVWRSVGSSILGPVISSSPNAVINIGNATTYSGVVQAYDPEGAPITYSANALSFISNSDITINTTTGAFTVNVGNFLACTLSLDVTDGTSTVSKTIEIRRTGNATGGTISSLISGAGSTMPDKPFTYQLHRYTATGNSTFIPDFTGEVEYLIVGGGGGGGGGGGTGGTQCGGGGGGGGVLIGTANVVANTSYTVTVGAGGIGGSTNPTTSTNGENSSVFNIVALGGGRGGGAHASGTSYDGTYSATSGGSGGGAGGGTYNNAGSGTAGQGSNGAIGVSGQSVAGGGGGATEVGNVDAPGAGGDGIRYIFNGTLTFYGGGGGAGGTSSGNSPAAGGDGGGGSGAYGTSLSGATSANAGTANTGGGGGGGAPYRSGGGAGGSGIVMIRYRLT